MVLELFWSTVFMGDSPWRASHMIAAIVMGSDVLPSSHFSPSIVAAALLAH